MFTPEQFRKELLQWFIAEKVGETILDAHWEWRDDDLAKQQFQSARITYQSESGRGLRASELLLNSTQKSVRLYDVEVSERYRICIQVEKTPPLSDDRLCIDYAPKAWNLTASIGSSVGAFLALGIVVLVVWLSQRACGEERRKRRGAKSSQSSGLEGSALRNYSSSFTNSRPVYSTVQDGSNMSMRERCDVFPLEYYEDGEESADDYTTDEEGVPYSSSIGRGSVRKGISTNSGFDYETREDPRDHFHDDVDLLNSNEQLPIHLDTLQEMQRCTCGYIHVIQTDDFLLFEGDHGPVYSNDMDADLQDNVIHTAEHEDHENTEKL